MTAVEIAAALLLGLGGFFYLAGTVGLLRFPDVHSRLHALTKADNLGLGLVCLAMALLAGSWRSAAMLLVIWLLGLLAATVSCHLVAQAALKPPSAAPNPPAAHGVGDNGAEGFAPMGRSFKGNDALPGAPPALPSAPHGDANPATRIPPGAPPPPPQSVP